MRRAVGLLVGALALSALAACRNESAPGSGSGMAPESGGIASSGAAVVTAPGEGVDWPRFRGPNGTGISPETGLNKNWAAKAPGLLWKAQMRDNGYAGPSVADGRVFIIDHEGDQDVVRALDFGSGKEIWRFPYPDTGSENNGFARATPTYEGGRVYTLSRLGLLHCLDARTGGLVWKHDLAAEFQAARPQWDLSGSPLIDGDKLIVMTGSPRGAVLCLNKQDGAVIWQGGGSDKPGYSTPVIATINGRKQYVMMGATSVMGVDASGGSLLWSYPWKTEYDVNAASPVVFGSSVFISSGYGHGCAVVDVGSGAARLRWENKEIQAHFSSAIYSQGYLYGTGDPGNLVCLNPANGQAMWTQPGFEKGGIIAADGVLYGLCGGSGELVMASLSPSGYKELGRVTPLGGQSWTAPILAHGRLIVRNKAEIACIEAR